MSKIHFTFRIDPEAEKEWQALYKKFVLIDGADTLAKSYREFVYVATQLGMVVFKEKIEELHSGQ